MQGKRFGGYLVGERLGSGGMGTVYAATREDDPDADPVALKIIHPHLLGHPGFFKRFLREAEIGKRVRHENVVRTIDADAAVVSDEQVHFLVMEYVAGRTLRELLGELGTVPEALVREVARQTAAGLAAIHAAGAVHRDLKPENILITDDQRVRIMDLGVARELNDATALTLEGQFAGSVRYAAPEQFGSGPITAAIDLYALGLLAFELVVGEHPFPADTTNALIVAHMSDAPPRAVDRSTEVSTFLSDLIDVLLAKDAADRVPSATALEGILSEGEESEWWSAREGTALREIAHHPRVPVRRETAVMGRADEAEVLEQAWARACAGEGGVILVEGETGIGKSRLLDSLVDGIEDNAAHVLYGSYAPSGGMGGLSDAVVSHFGGTGLEAALRPYLGQSPSLISAFAAMVRHETPPPGVETPALTAVHSLYTQLLHGLAEERPVLWIVEDLHFADSIGLQLATTLARAAEGRRVLMVLTGTPGLPPEELSHLGRLESFQRIQLKRLSISDVVALLRSALRSNTLAERLAPSIHRKSDGVPFFVFEMLRGLKEGRYLSETDDGSFVESKSIRDIEVPETVKDLIGARLAGLDLEHRSLLEAAAVQGFIFDADALATIVDQPLVRVLQTLAHLERGTGVIRAEGRQYRFDHHQLQEVVYSEIHPRLREEYHTLVAEAFRAGIPDVSAVAGETAYRIADHHLRGSRPADGIDCVLAALKHLLLTYRHEASARLTERALEIDGAERFEILMARIKSLHELGRREEEEDALRQAQALAGPGERGRVLRAFGVYYLRTSKIDRAGECVQEALTLARADGDRQAEADTLGQLGSVLAHRGLYAEALSHYEVRLAISRELGDLRGEAAASDSMGEVLSGLGRNEEALVHAERAVELCRKLGLKRMLASATGNLANLRRGNGDLEIALTLGQQYIDLNREVGFREGIAIGTGNLARVQAALGNLGTAAEQYRRSAALCRELGNHLTEGMSLGLLGSLLMDIGDFDGSRKNLEVARGLFEKIGDRRLVGYCVRELGEVATETGDTTLAGRLLDQAQAEFAAQPFPPGEAGLWLSRGKLAAATDDPAAADLLERATTAMSEMRQFNGWLEAAARLATVRPEAVQQARALFEEHGWRLAALEQVRVRWFLYLAGNEEEDLRAAKEGIEQLAARTKGPAGEWIVSRIPLHREIVGR